MKTAAKDLACGNATTRTFSDEEALSIIAHIEKIPQARSHDILVGRLAEELDCSRNRVVDLLAEHGSRPVDMSTYLGQHYPHVLGEDADLLRKTFGRIPTALPTDKNGNQFSKELGFTHRTHFNRVLTAEDNALGMLKREPNSEGRNRILRYWSAEARAIIAERIRYKRSLPPHVLPGVVISQLVNTTVAVVRSRLLQSQTKERFLIPHNYRKPQELTCYSWNDIQALEERYGRTPGFPKIDYDRMPKTREENKDPEKRAYARSIQMLVMTAEQMGNPSDLTE